MVKVVKKCQVCHKNVEGRNDNMDSTMQRHMNSIWCLPYESFVVAPTVVNAKKDDRVNMQREHGDVIMNKISKVTKGYQTMHLILQAWSYKLKQ